MNKHKKSLLENVKAMAERANGFAIGTALYFMFHPVVADASVLSSGICKFYRKVADNELFTVLAVIALVIAIVGFKLTKDSKVLSNILGIVIAVLGLVNIETIVTSLTGSGLVC